MAEKKEPASRKGPGNERSKESEEAILKAAIKIFEEQGYARATITHISRRAGISVESLYECFPSKESLLRGVLDRHIRKMHVFIRRQISKVGKGGDIDFATIRSLVEAILTWHQRESTFYRLVFEDIPKAGQILWSRARKAEDRTVAQLVELLESAHGIRDIDKKTAAGMFFQTANWLSYRHVRFKRKTVSDEAFIETLADMVQRYLFVSPYQAKKIDGQ
ncbi:MAG: TetR/AcrR family transcriptional regulator [Proteobacteria bacterium]|nr:TetR/AcrR family transcriptional regulator [Pseudomonadota bacterium]